jgi:hypothetical protein
MVDRVYQGGVDDSRIDIVVSAEVCAGDAEVRV